MKLNKTFGRIATTLVATAMLASVAAVPAFAEPVTSGGTADSSLSQITIDKQLMLPTGVVTPDVTFNFNIEPANDVEENDTIVSDSKTLEVKNGIGNNMAAGSVSFSSADGIGSASSYAGINVVTKADVTLSLTGLGTFGDAGVYKYYITEDQINIPDTETPDSDYAQDLKLPLYVFVERHTPAEGAESYYIASAVIYPYGATADGEANSKTDVFTNWYQITPPTDPGEDPIINSGNLSVTKKVTGTMGDRSEEFEFKVAGLEANAPYRVAYTGTGSGAENMIANSDGEITLNLKHDEVATIYGIDEKSNGYSISENGTTLNSEGYTLTGVKVDGETAEISDNGVTVSVVKGQVTSAEFTNNREAVSPTGIVMNVAPYVLLVVVAAAGCFVFLRKRRED